MFNRYKEEKVTIGPYKTEEDAHEGIELYRKQNPWTTIGILKVHGSGGAWFADIKVGRKDLRK